MSAFFSCLYLHKVKRCFDRTFHQISFRFPLYFIRRYSDKDLSNIIHRINILWIIGLKTLNNGFNGALEKHGKIISSLQKAYGDGSFSALR